MSRWPYDAIGYCKYCGKGEFKPHATDCKRNRVIDLPFDMRTEQPTTCPVCKQLVTTKSLDHTLVDVTTFADPPDERRFVVSECRKGKL